jgi:transglutaminase-like putative cysteine protease
MSAFRPHTVVLHACRVLAALCLIASAPLVAAAQTVPEAPAQLSVDSVQGNVVSLSWDPPQSAPPDGYVLEGGFAPDEVAGSLALGNGTTATQLALPPGVYFLRTFAVENGVRSAASNEVRVSVGVPEVPSRPEDFKGLAVGRGVTLSWRQTFDGGTPSEVLLDVQGPISGTFPLAPSGAFRVDGAPDGVYTLRLRASNSAGASAATPPVTLTVPGLVARVEQGPSRPPGDAGLPVRFELFNAPRIEQLAAREGLAGVVAGAATEFEAVLKLKEWVAAQFPHSSPDPYPPWDALIVLDAIRGGLTGGFCAQYSQVLLQSLAALGYPARYVEIGRVDNPYAHFPMEFWSNQFNKWVLLDADFNLHFEKNGVPLSALEVHDAAVTGTANAVEVVAGAFRDGHPSPNDWPHRTTELYYYVRYHLKADHVSAPFEPAFDRWGDVIEFTDSRTTPWESSTVASPFPKEQLTASSTSDRSMVEAPLNQLWVTPRVTSGTDVLLDLALDMPQIVAAEYRVVDATGQPGPWHPHGSPTLAWAVGPDDRAIEVRGVNLRGITGPATRVALVAP